MPSLLWIPLLALAVPTHGLAQEATPAPSAEVVLRVEGLAERPRTFSADDLAKLPRRTVDTQDHDGKPVRFAGVALAEVLKASGAPLGDALRGSQLARFLLVEASDGYKVVFALPELDPAFTDAVVLLADRREGQALAAAEGPLRLVVPHERRQARWVRQVKVLRLLHAAPEGRRAAP